MNCGPWIACTLSFNSELVIINLAHVEMIQPDATGGTCVSMSYGSTPEEGSYRIVKEPISYFMEALGKIHGSPKKQTDNA